MREGKDTKYNKNEAENKVKSTVDINQKVKETEETNAREISYERKHLPWSCATFHQGPIPLVPSAEGRTLKKKLRMRRVNFIRFSKNSGQTEELNKS